MKKQQICRRKTSYKPFSASLFSGLIVLLTLIAFVSAALVIEAHGQGLSSVGSDTTPAGAKIMTFIDVNLTTITKHSSVDADTACILASNQAVLNCTTFSGDDATFFTGLIAGTEYIISINDTGSYTQFRSGSLTFNITGTNLNWTNGYLQGQPGDGDFDRIYNVVSLTINTGDDITSILSSPANDTTLAKQNITFNATQGTSNSFGLKNATYNVWFSNGTLFNQTTVVIDGIANETSLEIPDFVLNDYKWNVEACGENTTSTTCDSAPNNFTLFVKSKVNDVSFNSTTFETIPLERFILNLSSLGNATPTDAKLQYDGTNITAAISSQGSTFLLSANVADIPLVASPTNRSFKFTWNIDSTLEVSNVTNQTVQPILFNLCNATLTVPYLNLTFANETLGLESVNASASADFTFWFGSGTLNQSSSFLNATENVNYQFCFSPVDRTVNIDYSVDYTNVISQQRTFSEATALTNTTTERTLYLLPTISGLFAQFQAVDSVGNPLSLIKGTITRIIGVSTITVASAFTDSSGIVTYFLNPDATYNGLFTGTGFVDNSFSFVPITDQRLVIMGTLGGETNGSQIGLNTSYLITPTNSSLQNNTDVDFGFDVTSQQTITLISMNITNSTGGQMGFNSTAGTGLITLTINTGNQTRINGEYIITTSNETITVSKTWIVGNEFIGDYSLFNQLDVFLDYGFQDFIRLLMVIAVIMGVIIFMSAGEISDTSESKVIVGLLLVWAFSVVGWLDNPIVVAESGLAQFARQYGIAILSTAMGSYFILRRLFIRRI